MNAEITEIIESLENLAQGIFEAHPTSSTDENINQPLNLVINANFPSISKRQIIDFIEIEVSRIKNLNLEFDKEFLTKIEKLSNYIDEESKKIQLLLNQQNQTFIDKIVQVISIVNLAFQKYLDWQHVSDPKKLPRELKQRVSTVQNALSEVEESSQNIQQKVKTINEAYDAATELPVLLQDLKENKKQIDLIKSDSNENLIKIKADKNTANEDLKKITALKSEADQLIKSANEVLKQMQDKLTISTGIGLAHAFSNRSNELKTTSYWWTGGFITSLICTFIIAFIRFNDLKASITQDTPISYVIIQIIISLISLSAPVWFAIISSKQIQKLFTLSEDYAYKASISASYEGYRQEAYDIDPELVKKLLGTALTKVDEAPLRLIGKEKSSTPFEELLNQPYIKELIETFPETKERLLNIITDKNKTKPTEKPIENLSEKQEDI